MSDSDIEIVRPEEALQRVQKSVNPRDFAMMHQYVSFLEDFYWDFRNHVEKKDMELAQREASLLLVGKAKSDIIFVMDMPDADSDTFSEASAGIFKSQYLDPVGLDPNEVSYAFLRKSSRDKPQTQDLKEVISDRKDVTVVAVGKQAKAALGDLSSVSLPHPIALGQRENIDNTEIVRKMQAVMKKLDKENAADHNSGNPSHGMDASESRSVKIQKAVQEKRIVYGVVLTPYGLDTQDDWIEPKLIEETAHEYVRKHRTTGLQHMVEMPGCILESTLVEYPTPEDYAKAMRNEDHNAYVRKYGSDTVRSGDWILGMEMAKPEWELHNRGLLTGFSVGGLGVRKALNPGDMPKVTFIEQGQI